MNMCKYVCVYKYIIYIEYTAVYFLYNTFFCEKSSPQHSPVLLLRSFFSSRRLFAGACGGQSASGKVLWLQPACEERLVVAGPP